MKDIDWIACISVLDRRYINPSVAPNVMTVRLTGIRCSRSLLSHGLVDNVHRMGPSDIFTGLEAAAECTYAEMRDTPVLPAGWQASGCRPRRNRTAPG